MRGKTREDWKLLDLLDPVAEAEGFAIVRLRLLAGDKTRRLQVLAERDDGSMPVEACARLARALSRVLDDADPIAGGYSLEVSSPGIDRPLTRLEDFAHHAGLEARVELDQPRDGRRRFRGLLAGVEGDDVRIAAGEAGEIVRLPFHEIGEARLVVNEALLERGASERARRLERQESSEERGQP